MNDEYEDRPIQRTDPEFLERWANAYKLATTTPTDKRFNINSWGKKEIDSACGTAACLAGHCALNPWFREQGLTAAIYKAGGMDVCLVEDLEFIEEASKKNNGQQIWAPPAPWLKRFFGCNATMIENDNRFPFWPNSYYEAFESEYCDEYGQMFDEDGREYFEPDDHPDFAMFVTPQRGAKKIYDWMCEHWSRAEADAAIEAATATYNANLIHEYTAAWYPDPTERRCELIGDRK